MALKTVTANFSVGEVSILTAYEPYFSGLHMVAR